MTITLADAYAAAQRRIEAPEGNVITDEIAVMLVSDFEISQEELHAVSVEASRLAWQLFMDDDAHAAAERAGWSLERYGMSVLASMFLHGLLTGMLRERSA